MLTLPGKCPPDILPVGTRLGAPARLVCAASVESRLPARHGVGGQEGGGGRVGGGGDSIPGSQHQGLSLDIGML